MSDEADVLDDSPLPVLTAVVSPSLEAALVADFGRRDLGVTVVRRCVDIVELLSAAASGTARAALVSADLRGLDAESMSDLGRYGLATVGLAADEAQDKLLHQLGAGLVLPSDAKAEQVAGALRAAAVGMAAVVGADRQPLRSRALATDRMADPKVGSLIAVWGPAGAPGRTTLALGLADALTQLGAPADQAPVLLIDADPYGGSVAMLTGQLDEAPGITAACRAANAGTLDVARLSNCCIELVPGFRILTGLSQASRWPELRPAALDVVFSLARQLARVTVLDCGFCLEEDEDLIYDTLAPQRNGATLTALRSADRVIAIASSDPLGLARLTRDLSRLATCLGEPLAELSASGRLVVVVNRVRPGLLPGNPRLAAAAALAQHTGITPSAALPLDMAAADVAHGRGELLSEAAPDSALFSAMIGLAEHLSDPAGAAGRTLKPRLRRGFKRRSQLVAAPD